jgi:hypothetical protein
MLYQRLRMDLIRERNCPHCRRLSCFTNFRSATGRCHSVAWASRSTNGSLASCVPSMTFFLSCLIVATLSFILSHYLPIVSMHDITHVLIFERKTQSRVLSLNHSPSPSHVLLLLSGTASKLLHGNKWGKLNTASSMNFLEMLLAGCGSKHRNSVVTFLGMRTCSELSIARLSCHRHIIPPAAGETGDGAGLSPVQYVH